MFEIRLRKLAAALKLTGGALTLALCLAGSSAYATAAIAAEPVQLEGALVPALSAVTPILGVSVGTVSWAATGEASFYELAVSNAPRGAAGRVTKYLSLARGPGDTQTYTPSLETGQTVYVGVSAENGPNWSVEEAVVTSPGNPPAPEPPVAKPPAPEPPIAELPPVEPPIAASSTPQLSVKGTTIDWTAAPGVLSYTFATILDPTTTRSTTYTVVTGTSYTPPAVPGQTVNYGLSASVPGVAPWAQEVTITYPAVTPAPPTPPVTPTPPVPPPPVTPTPPIAPIPGGKIIGTNDGAGWGEAPAKTILAGHITWNRVEIGAQSNTVPASLSDGFKILAIVGNTADGAPISQTEPNQWGAEVVNQINANPGISIAEAGNEMYLKGGVANPVQYGKMYLAAVDAMKLAGIHIPLLFNMWGNYSSPSGYSDDASGRGWLRDAVNGVPGLAAAIAANGLGSHPYGAIGENNDDENGINAVAAQESIAQSALGSIPPFYITEFGYDMSRCGAFNGACSQQDQANKMRAAYDVFLSDRHVAGIWWFESHDDGEGQFGFMNGDNTTRPSFDVLSAIAQEQGQ